MFSIVSHTFWDCETWMYPSVLLVNPAIAKGLIQYRYKLMSGAVDKAKSYHPPYQGTMYVW